jgi:hypothetical protein
VIRAVLDTSVLVPYSLRRDLQQAAQIEAYTGIWSPWIVGELNRVLAWRWIKQHGHDQASKRECSRQAKAMMSILLPSFELVAPIPPYPLAWDSLTDQWDHPIWAAAREGNAGYVVSENTRDFPPADEHGRHAYQGIEYQRGRVFLEMVETIQLAHKP